MSEWTSSDDIRTTFSEALSAMYRIEVQRCGTFIELVAEVSDATMAADFAPREQLISVGELGCAAGIFHSNLGDADRKSYSDNANRESFAAALGAAIFDAFVLYDRTHAFHRERSRHIDAQPPEFPA